MTIAIVLLAICGLSVACGDDEEGAALTCVENLPATCAATFPAAYDPIYTQVIQQRCGTSGSGSSCHGSMGKQGGLELSTPDIAFQELLGSTGKPRVVPGDPKCSILMERLESSDPSVRMPLGEGPLPAGVRCAIQTWIQSGAER